MSDLKNIIEQLKSVENGLYRMSPARVRAMSTHETDDLVIELEAKIKNVIAQLEKESA